MLVILKWESQCSVQIYNEQWSPGQYDYDTEADKYYDLLDELQKKICESNEDPEMNKVCCSEDDIKVGIFLNQGWLWLVLFYFWFWWM